MDTDGTPKEEYEPGAEVKAKVTILGEGPRGTLSRKLMNHFKLQEGRNEMAYEMGCKEVLQFPKGTIKDGFVHLLAGYPLGLPGVPGSTFGGGFIYSMAEDKVCIGLLAVLDAPNPDQDVQYLLQKIKLHPKIRAILGKGKVVKYGAKAVTVGGWGCMPKPMSLVSCWTQLLAMLSSLPKMVTPGRYEDLEKHYRGADDDDAYIIDKLTAVYLSGSIHDEHQPCHLKVRPEIRSFAPDHCVTKCTEEYGNPCERFCPAQVYNIVDDATEPNGKRLQVDFSNVFM